MAANKVAEGLRLQSLFKKQAIIKYRLHRREAILGAIKELAGQDVQQAPRRPDWVVDTLNELDKEYP